MTDPAESYTPRDMRQQFRRQAAKVWIVTTVVVTAWVLAILIAPALAGQGSGAASSIYSFFSYICHQIPERSLTITGFPMAVCSRCFGVYGGLVIGTLIYPLWRPVDETEPVSRFWLFLSLVPITIDWSLTVFGVWENTHVSRFVTGMILGIACATFIVPAVVEIVRNLAARRHVNHKAAL